MPNFIKQDYEAILNRMKLFLKVHDDSEVAKELGVTRSALSDFKKRKRFPPERIIQFCLTHKLPIEWLLIGEKGPLIAAENIPPYGLPPSLTELIEKLKAVYFEGTLDEKIKVKGAITAVFDEIKDRREGKYEEKKKAELDQGKDVRDKAG